MLITTIDIPNFQKLSYTQREQAIATAFSKSPNVQAYLSGYQGNSTLHALGEHFHSDLNTLRIHVYSATDSSIPLMERNPDHKHFVDLSHELGIVNHSLSISTTMARPAQMCYLTPLPKDFLNIDTTHLKRIYQDLSFYKKTTGLAKLKQSAPEKIFEELIEALRDICQAVDSKQKIDFSMMSKFYQSTTKYHDFCSKGKHNRYLSDTSIHKNSLYLLQATVDVWDYLMQKESSLIEGRSFSESIKIRREELASQIQHGVAFLKAKHPSLTSEEIPSLLVDRPDFAVSFNKPLPFSRNEKVDPTIERKSVERRPNLDSKIHKRPVLKQMPREKTQPILTTPSQFDRTSSSHTETVHTLPQQYERPIHRKASSNTKDDAPLTTNNFQDVPNTQSRRNPSTTTFNPYDSISYDSLFYYSYTYH